MTLRSVLAIVASSALFSCTFSDAKPSAGQTSSALDGDWRVTVAGRDAVGNGSVVSMNALSATGHFADADEGVSYDNCTHSKSRTEFTFQIEGNNLTGTITKVDEYTGTGLGCQSNTPSSDSYPVVGTRSTSATSFDGQWDVQIGQSGRVAPPIVVTVTGQSAKAWDRDRKAKGDDPQFTLAIANGSAVATADNRDFSFGATKE